MTHGDREVSSFAYDKVRALLGYLASTPGVRHTREKIATIFWPSAARGVALNNLRRAVFELRQQFKSLGVSPIYTDRSSIYFDPEAGVCVDLGDFLVDVDDVPSTAEAAGELTRRTALYGGAFLEGLHVPDSQEFDYWLQPQRESLLRRQLGLLDALITWHLGQGQRDVGIRFARRKVELAPWIEANYGHLMQLLGESGNIGQVSQVFRDCQRYLQAELGCAPKPETAELARRLGCEHHVDDETLKSPEVHRIPLTVLACRVLSQSVGDTDDVFSKRSSTKALCADRVQQRNGRLVALHATLFFAYFGYPTSREQAPREAIEAALDIREAIANVPGLDVCIGLSSGWSVLDDDFVLPDASGETSDRSLGLAERAMPGEVLVSASLLDGVGKYFLAEQHSVNTQRIMQRTHEPHRPPMLADHAPLIGRRGELHSLLTYWQELPSRGLTIAQISGEPGIGKSKLLQAFARQVQVKRGLLIELSCQPEEQSTPYFPIVATLQRQFDMPVGQPPEVRLRHLEQQMAGKPPYLEKHLPVITRLLGLPSGLESTGTPQQEKQLTERALCALLDEISTRGALLVLLEDIHWADASTLDLLRVLAVPSARKHAQRLMIVTSSRTLQDIGGFMTHLALAPLSTEESRDLVRTLNPMGLDDGQLDEVVRRSDGIPLYLEQIVHCIHERDAQEDIPDTLRDLLASRIASQGMHGKLAQQAAVIGREFDIGMLSALWDDSTESLTAGLASLGATELIHPSNGGLAFRHTLIRDAAYFSLPVEERRALHLRLSQVLRVQFSELVRQRPELLARHLHAATDAAAAAAWLRSGRHAAEASMQQQACHFFESGIVALAFIRDAATRNDMEFRLQVGLGNALVALQGYASAASKLVFARALSLTDDLSDESDIFQVLWGLWLGGRTVDSSAPPLSLAHKLAHAARNSDDPGMCLQVSYAYGNNYFWLGQHVEARKHLEDAIAQGQHVDSADLIARFGENSSIAAMAFLSWIDWLEGKPVQARARAEQTIQCAKAIGHAHTTGFALAFSTVLYRHLRLPQQVMVVGQELMQLAHNNGLLLWQAVGAMGLGWASVSLGEEEGLVPLRLAVSGAQQAMSSVECTILSFLVDALYQLGRYEEALVVVDQSIATAYLIQDVYLIPEFLRLKGEIMLALQPDAKTSPQAYFLQGLELAEQQGAKLFSLRLATSLARCVGRSEDYAVLSSIYRTFTEGLDLPDLVDARQALEQRR